MSVTKRRRLRLLNNAWYFGLGRYLAGAFLMIWWKPTIVRPLVAASFEAHARIVQFEVSEIFERAEQFSLMTSSALTLDNVFNLTSSAVALGVS